MSSTNEHYKCRCDFQNSRGSDNSLERTRRQSVTNLIFHQDLVTRFSYANLTICSTQRKHTMYKHGTRVILLFFLNGKFLLSCLPTFIIRLP